MGESGSPRFSRHREDFSGHFNADLSVTARLSVVRNANHEIILMLGITQGVTSAPRGQGRWGRSLRRATTTRLPGVALEPNNGGVLPSLFAASRGSEIEGAEEAGPAPASSML